MKKIILGILWMFFLTNSINCVAQKKNSSTKKTPTKPVQLFLPAEFFGKWVDSIEKCGIIYEECDQEGEPFILKKIANGIEMNGPRWGSKIYSITKISENCFKIKYKELHCEMDSSDTSMIITLKGNDKLLVDYGYLKETYILCE